MRGTREQGTGNRQQATGNRNGGCRARDKGYPIYNDTIRLSWRAAIDRHVVTRPFLFPVPCSLFPGASHPNIKNIKIKGFLAEVWYI